jgi:hypothetical protein
MMAAKATLRRDRPSPPASANTNGPTTKRQYIAAIIASLIVIMDSEAKRPAYE